MDTTIFARIAPALLVTSIGCVDMTRDPGPGNNPSADMTGAPSENPTGDPTGNPGRPPRPDLSVPPSTNGSGVGPTGGSVGLMRFGITGDTRPPACEDTAGYPSQVISSIATQIRAANAQFALDLGDHMYVCNNDLNTAQTQMGLYMTAIQQFGGTWFMTEGNHECYRGPCLAGSQNANYLAFMSALAPISNSPYYSFDIQTSLGLATFVIVADNSWDSNQASWLDQTLATADQNAKYTIVARHHPPGDSSVSTNADSATIIRNHKFSLFLTGHSHLYKHMTTDGGRDLVLGTGGAPLIAGGAFWGYALIDQQSNGSLQVSVYDISSSAQVDTWSVGPN